MDRTISPATAQTPRNANGPGPDRPEAPRSEAHLSEAHRSEAHRAETCRPDVAAGRCPSSTSAPYLAPAGKDVSPASTNALADRVANRLRDHMGAARYDRWFSNARFDVREHELEIAAQSPFVARWIKSHFADEIRDIAAEVLGREIDINVSFAESAKRPAAPAPTPAPAAAPPRSAPSSSRPRGLVFRRLDEFVVGSSNRLAYAAARRIATDDDAGEISPLFIHGDCGVGKTHLLQGICRLVTDRTGRRGAVRYVTGEQFTNEYITAVRNQELDQFRARVRRLDLLAIDDVHFLSNKTRTQSEFLHTLDSIDLTGSRVVLASDGHPRLIKRFNQALVSRFLSGMVVSIDPPDRPTRATIVRQLADRRGIPLHAAAAEAIAERCIGSVRELEGALTKLAALHALSAGDTAPTGLIGMVTVEQLFRESMHTTAVPVRLSTIVDVILERLAVSRTDVLGSSRQRRVVLGRALVAFLARDLTNHSFPEIARALGRTYHSTMHTAAGRLRGQLKDDISVDLADGVTLPLRELVDQLRYSIRNATG